MKRILIACEFTGVVRRAFAEKGHDVWSCDLLDTLIPGQHIKANVLEVIDYQTWDMMIAHPPCTYLCSSGQLHARKDIARAIKSRTALMFFSSLLNAPIEQIAIENPVGIASTRIKKPDQIIQPYEFGDDASKKTCLWLKNLPKLVPTTFVPPRKVNGVFRWSNQTDAGNERTPPSVERGLIRSVTYLGIAKAMADQWG